MRDDKRVDDGQQDGQQLCEVTLEFVQSQLLLPDERCIESDIEFQTLEDSLGTYRLWTWDNTFTTSRGKISSPCEFRVYESGRVYGHMKKVENFDYLYSRAFGFELIKSDSSSYLFQTASKRPRQSQSDVTHDRQYTSERVQSRQ
jgi:hypothetical protein